MHKILGLDLGTNSIGWAIIENDRINNKEIFELNDKGVIIFSEGVKKEKGNEISRAAERTGFRSARRLKFRRKLRKYETLLVLSKNGMCPLTEDEVIAWKKSNFKIYPNNEDFLIWLATDDKVNKNPYYFRYKASRGGINKLELGRAFYHLAQRRGFLSNRLDQSDKGAIEKHQPNINEILKDSESKTDFSINLDVYFKDLDILDRKAKDLNEGDKKLKTLYNSFVKILMDNIDFGIAKEKIEDRLFKKENLGKVKQSIEDLDDKIKAGNFETLGQYFYSIYGKSNQRIRNQYTAREGHYLAEFEQICKVQGLGIICAKENEPNKRYKRLALDLYKAIFYQRPLKSQKGLVGKCTLEPTKYRCPVSRPEFEEYRMYQYLNNFKIKTPEDEKLRELTKDEKEKVEYLFHRKKVNFDFEEIVKKLIPKNEKAVYYKDKDASDSKYVVNFKLNTSLSNCPTIAHFRTVFGNDWKNIAYSYNTVNEKGVGKVRTINYQDVWHIWTTFTTNEKLYKFATTKLGLSEKQATQFSKVTLKKDYASLSLKAINNILPYLKDGLIYSSAVFMANMKNVVKVQNWNNDDDRNLIQLGIKKIIKTHQRDNKLLFVINGYIKNNIKSSYSKEADIIYRKELEQSFEFEFGKKKWRKINTNDLFEDNYALFVDKFSKSEDRFLKIKRIDEKVIDFLEGENETGEVFLKDKKHLDKLYHPSDIEKFKLEKAKNNDGVEFTVLGSPLSNSIKNPMAMKSLHKVRELINTLILEEKINENTKIHIELARELNDANKRKAIQKWQKDREDERKIYREKIQELYQPDFEPTLVDIEKFRMVLEQREDKKLVSNVDVSKYKLWEEQRHICLYTGYTIGLADFLNKITKYDIEHTIPRSISIDDSQMNKTLCDNKFNRDVKKNQIPFQLVDHKKIMSRISHWKDRFEKLDTEIKGLVRASKTASDKETKDRIIQKRHYLKMEYNYWRGKYARFENEEINAGFKNSQIVDIGIITKYAQQYLKSYFKKVYSVKGTMVDQFKKAWGIKKTIIDENDIEKKDRSNHIHHCEDAIAIACMTKNKYDVLAHAWGLEEKEKFNAAKTALKNSKPWKSFAEDVKNLSNEVLIVHSHKDKVPIQSKKKIRKRGKIQYRIVSVLPKGFFNKKVGKDYFIVNGNKYKIPMYQQGDTVRGSLHNDTFYGAILVKNPNNEKDFYKDEDGNGAIKYVVRKQLDGIKKTDVDKIVDNTVQEIVKKAIQDKVLVAKKDVYKIETDKTVWMNVDKQIPIRKVRVYASSVRNPLKDFKKHVLKDKSKHPHKREYYVQNEENYCMAIYEGKDKKGKVKRSSELINMLDAGKLLKLKRENNSTNEIVSKIDKKTNYPLKYVLTKGKMVLLYENTPEEVWELSDNEMLERLFEITQLDKEGNGIKLLYHQEAREKKKITAFMGLKIGMKGGKNIGKHKQYPWLKIGHNAFDALVEGYDFNITSIGRIEKL